VHESNVFIALGLASSEKQIPQIVENIGNQNKGVVTGAVAGVSCLWRFPFCCTYGQGLAGHTEQQNPLQGVCTFVRWE